jgi:7-carboxy-7-deazaguanine synthase
MSLRIAEIFGLVVQGEGPLIGRPTVFVRAGGCDYRCSWCDTPYAVLAEHRHEWMPMEPDEVLDAVTAISPPCLVTLSGGNPATQDFGPLIARGHAADYEFACETQGSIDPDWLGDLDALVLSPKPPSSGMETDWDALARCVTLGVTGWPTARRTALKVVVFDEADYAFAREVERRHRGIQFFLQVGNPTPPLTDGADPGFDPLANLASLRWLMDKVCADRWTTAHVLPQLHLLAFGNERCR